MMRTALFTILFCFLLGGLSPAYAVWGSATVSPDGKRLYVAMPESDAVAAIDTSGSVAT
jgi:DNA-binding beta-propeller fold protein YncE